MLEQFDSIQVELRDKGFILSIPPSSGPTLTLNPKWFKIDQWNDRKIIISVGKLLVGLPIPLLDPRISLFYKILSHDKFRRAIFQLSGDAIRIMVEFARHAAGLGSLYPREYRNEAYVDLEINSADYTVDSFFANYEVVIMKPESSRWAVRLSRKDGLAEHERIMRDVDFNDKKNHTARNSNNNCWNVYPVILEGPYITGYGDNRLIAKLEKDYNAYKKQSTLEALRSITDEVEGLDICGTDDEDSFAEGEHFFDSYSSGLSWEKFMRFSELNDPANGFIVNGTCVIAAEVSWTLKEDPIVDSKLAGVKLESDPAKIEETETEKKTKLKDGKSGTQLGEHPGAGQTFGEGRHNNKIGFSDEKEFEDVGGFSIWRTQAPIYMQIWLKYGHIPSTQVMPISSYPVLVMVVKDLMNSIIDMHQCRYVDLSSEMIEGWEEKIKMAETIKFNVEWLREGFESVKKGVCGMQEVKNELQEHGQPLRAAKSKIKTIEDELKKTEAQLIAAKDYLRENISGMLSESDMELYPEIGEDLLLEGLF